MLDQRKVDPAVDWSSINNFRTKFYGIQESTDTTRKGYKLLSEYLDSGWKLIPPENETDVSSSRRKVVTYNSDNSQTLEQNFNMLDTPENFMTDEDSLLRLHGVDPNKFELVSAKTGLWDSPVGNKQMASSKITIRPRTPRITFEMLENWFHKLDRDFTPAVKFKSEKYLQGNKALIIPISDLHYNLRSSILTSGNLYNCKIAEDSFFNILNDVLNKCSKYVFNKIIFTISGDMLNADNPNGTTYKGTAQDNELDYFEACENLFAMTVKAINMLAGEAPVEVVFVPGNHDFVTGFMLAHYLQSWFRNDFRVHVDTSPFPRKYIVFGKNLFVFSHSGDLKKLPQIIPDESRKFWSEVDYCDVFLQHMHCEMVLSEDHNMRIQRLPSVCGNSSWAASQGYKSKRQCKSFIYDKDNGLESVLYTTIKDKKAEGE